ncbi:hypothetical protein CKAN_01327500 [Cinnamomum micranthum f. kanehirae]|uniref:Zinc-ribbon 15 domain-containing protein n=1 Tax=Cinnamomum micranthum f. kanehirae TaxID=337451 RepID=A0A443P0Z6_9MAGN|nr:hypothetical protein CKAN_01327500 [Cinnamomum micranthum f. kanehirae]
MSLVRTKEVVRRTCAFVRGIGTGLGWRLRGVFRIILISAAAYIKQISCTPSQSSFTEILRNWFGHRYRIGKAEMVFFCFLVDQKQVIRNSKPAAGTCSRCGAGASVADMKTATRFCYVPFYWRSWRAIICTFCGAVLKSYK